MSLFSCSVYIPAVLTSCLSFSNTNKNSLLISTFSTSTQGSVNTAMVYPFPLPTTSHLSYQTFLTSSTHPSLPQAATTARHALRLALKTHKRLPRGAQQDAHLPALLAALNEYLPYAFTISYGLSGKPIDIRGSATHPPPSPGQVAGYDDHQHHHHHQTSENKEEIEITLHHEIESAWRPSLSSASFSSLSTQSSETTTTRLALVAKDKDARAGRVRGRGIDFELAFTLTTLGYVLSCLARVTVRRVLYASTTPTAEQRTGALHTATKYLLQASGVHSLLASGRFSTSTGTTSMGIIGVGIPELDPGVQAGLSSLALAEATLLAVLKDDAYVVACIQMRNPNDKEWMVRAPEVPKVRALVFARLCVRAAEYAEQAAAGFGAMGGRGKGGGAVDEELVAYARVLGRVSRARACRFFGVDAELAGKVGEGIAWLRAAKGALGARVMQSDTSIGRGSMGSSAKDTLSKWRRGWSERREEKKMEKDAGTRKSREDKGELLGSGDNAGREEEIRVIEMLETKWVKMNDTVSLW